ncbi:replicative DNA helicase [Rhodococcus sp. OK519]|uniref:AAA family ATPase n=1 Tax=Rhodococcus sp. OK519 TaxID=2135729 RepID=UPI000D380E96|nr:replicative DNA helicase [Rhodococcus sp. OK519]
MTDELTQIAWDEVTEQAALGLAILFPDKAGQAFLTIGPDDWYRPQHKELAAVVGKMLRTKQSVDAVTVFGQVQAQGLTRYWDAAKIFGLTQMAWRPESASQIAGRLRELSGRRKLVSALSVESRRLQSLSDDDGAAEVRATTARLRAACDAADETAADKETPLPQRMHDFLAADTAERQWLVPGLLERMDRTVVTGAEGGGKTTLVTQLAACMAGGVHPFGGNVMGDGSHSVRVLVIDCENSADQSRRRYRWVIDRVKSVREQHGFVPVDWNEQMCIDTRPAGIDLLSGKDISWLEHSISATAPDLVVLGPLYKLHHRDPSEEMSAREVAWVIDGLRERYGFALLTEAHAGNGTDMQGNRVMRPIGSSLWRRWPEFGFGLRRAKEDPGKPRAEIVDVVAWRGAREERAWPEKLQMGHTLPWIPDPDYLATMDDYH